MRAYVNINLMNMSKHNYEFLLEKEISEKQAIWNYFDCAENGFFIEVGANEPCAPESQTYHLEKMGWTGILVEPIEDLAEKARNTRLNSKVWQVACTSKDKQGIVEFLIPVSENELITGHASLYPNMDEHNYNNFKKVQVKSMTLDAILDAENVTKIDLLSIDVEGAEFEVLSGLDLKKYSPKLILLEDKHLYLSKHRYLTSHGYKLAQRLNRNSWYIPKSQTPPITSSLARFKLWKRMYVSIWIRKIQYAIRHKTLTPFRTL